MPADKTEIEMFPAGVIAKAIENLPYYYKADTVATLSAGDEPVSPEVLAAFANLAKTLKAPVFTNYATLEIRREKPAAEQRARALTQLRDAYRNGTIDAHGDPV